MQQIRIRKPHSPRVRSVRKFGLVIALLLAGLLFNTMLLWGAIKTQTASGIYVLVAEANTKELSHLLPLAGVKGVSLSVEWHAVEPQEGHFQWDTLDELVAKAAALGKEVTLRLLPGISTPEWVYQKGAKAFTFVDRNPFHGEALYKPGHRYSSFGQTLKIPIPWDDVFLASWERTVAAFGEHYRNATNIAMVHLAGPTRHSTEMILPRDNEDKGQWRSLGYAPQKLIGAWQRSIDAFARAFPQTPLVLNLSPVIFDDGVLEAVVRSGYDHYGRRFFLQNNILLGINAPTGRKDWKILQDYATKTTIGFQRELLGKKIPNWDKLSDADRLKLRRTNFEGMFARGMGLGAQYFEIGAAEARDFPEIVQQVAPRLGVQ
jgi:Beta-galactosidase